MNSEDQRFLNTLGLVEQEGGMAWRVLSRDGRVLMLLPDQGTLFRKGVHLYSPQRRAARGLAAFLKFVPGAKLILPLFRSDPAAASPLAEITKTVSGDMSGILLGNPTQEERRGLLLVSDPLGKTQVVKIGASLAARDQIRFEVNTLESLKSAHSDRIGIPTISQAWEEENFSAFSIPFFETRSKSKKQVADLLEILTSWLGIEKPLILRHSPSWKTVENQLDDDELAQVRGLQLRPSLRHGDLAPWNLVWDDDGRLTVIDWETALSDDIPGWDLVHYFLSNSKLVERSPPAETITGLKEKLEENPQVCRYLERCGWAGNESLLVKTYLWFRKDLLSEFEELMDSTEKIFGRK